MFPFFALLGKVIGKALIAAKSTAIGLGKGLLGMPGSSPLALAKTAAPALNASAMKLGQMAGTAALGKMMTGTENQNMPGPVSNDISPIPTSNALATNAPALQSSSPLASNQQQISPLLLEELRRRGYGIS